MSFIFKEGFTVSGSHHALWCYPVQRDSPFKKRHFGHLEVACYNLLATKYMRQPIEQTLWLWQANRPVTNSVIFERHVALDVLAHLHCPFSSDWPAIPHHAWAFYRTFRLAKTQEEAQSMRALSSKFLRDLPFVIINWTECWLTYRTPEEEIAECVNAVKSYLKANPCRGGLIVACPDKAFDLLRGHCNPIEFTPKIFRLKFGLKPFPQFFFSQRVLYWQPRLPRNP